MLELDEPRLRVPDELLEEDELRLTLELLEDDLDEELRVTLRLLLLVLDELNDDLILSLNEDEDRVPKLEFPNERDLKISRKLDLELLLFTFGLETVLPGLV